MKKFWLGFGLVFIGSLMVVGLSGCYYRGHDENYRNDRDHREDNRGHDDRKGDHDDRDRQH